MNFIKNQILNIKIEGLSSEAHGVGHVDGFTFFVTGALPGELVKAQIIKLYSSYGIARLLEIVIPSPERKTPECEVYKRCGGCALQHCDYNAQLDYKTKKVLDCLRIIGKYNIENLNPDVNIEPCLGMETPYRYRNKVQLPAGVYKGTPCFGFFAPRSHEIIPVGDCLLCHEENSEIFKLVLEFVNENNIETYSESTHTGVIRHLVTRISSYTGEIMVCIVINSKKMLQKEKLIEKLKCFNKDNKLNNGRRISSIFINVNTEKTNVILGEKSYCIWGEPFITDSVGGINFRISVNSFYQVNQVQTEKLYKKALDFTDCGKNGTAFDFYCGIGTISLFLAQRFEKVYGVETVKGAVEDAKANAELNGIGNVKFINAKAEEAAFYFIENNIIPDVIVVDPPRKGCDDKMLNAMLLLKPERIVYVSCNPATLARDINKISGAYKLDKISIFDCFPQTPHVECVAGLSRI